MDIIKTPEGAIASLTRSVGFGSERGTLRAGVRWSGYGGKRATNGRVAVGQFAAAWPLRHSQTEARASLPPTQGSQ